MAMATPVQQADKEARSHPCSRPYSNARLGTNQTADDCCSDPRRSGGDRGGAPLSFSGTLELLKVPRVRLGAFPREFAYFVELFPWIDL